MEKTRIKEGFCPIFRSDGYIAWKACNTSESTCPNRTYLSNEVYEYVYCFGNNSASTHEQENEELTRAEGFDDGKVIAIVFAILCIIAAVVLIILWKKHSSPNLQDDRGQPMLSNEVSVERSAEIVKDTIYDGASYLLETNVKSVVVLGRLGKGVSSTSYSIFKKFNTWKKWEILDCRYTEIPDTVKEKTVVLVYGWFGIWNDDLCSLERAKQACQSLLRILNETTKVKLIIGMRSDLYRKYQEELKVDDDHKHLFQNEINLDSANIKEDAKDAKYFYEKIRNKCQKSDCAFRKLKYDTIQTGKDNDVGMPLKLKLMKKYHDLIHDYEGEWDISMAMRDHLISLEKDKRKQNVYAWITYICFKGQFSRTEQFDTELVKQIGIHIDESSFNENDKDLRRYFSVRYSFADNNVSPTNAQIEYVFWHRFVYICAFKFWFEKDPELVMKFCNVDAILQLVRPEGVKTSYFEVTADEHYVNLFNERIHKLNLAERYEKHPLVKSRHVTQREHLKSCNDNKTIR